MKRKWCKPRMSRESKWLLLIELLLEAQGCISDIARALREYVDYKVHDVRRR